MAVRHRGTGEIIREGQVYVLQNESLGGDIFKIGMSTGDVQRRAAGVARHFNITGGLKVVFAQPTRDVDQLERRVHLKLRANKLTPDHPVSKKFGLEKSTEFFYGLTRDKIERTITASVKGLEREDSWCTRLKANPELVKEISGAEGELSPEDPVVRYWIDKLTTNGSQPVAEFTLRQIARGVKHTSSKTSYLTWKFGGKSRAWFDPTYPRSASTLIHFRFEGDWERWEDLLGPEGVFNGYRNETQIRLTLWSKKHMEATQKMVERIMPAAQFLY